MQSGTSEGAGDDGSVRSISSFEPGVELLRLGQLPAGSLLKSGRGAKVLAEHEKGHQLRLADRHLWRLTAQRMLIGEGSLLDAVLVVGSAIVSQGP